MGVKEPSLEEKFLGRKVQVTGIETAFAKNVTFTGECSFIGRNVLLNKKQVTVARTPLFLDNYKQVTLYGNSDNK